MTATVPQKMVEQAPRQLGTLTLGSFELVWQGAGGTARGRLTQLSLGKTDLSGSSVCGAKEERRTNSEPIAR